MDRETTWRGLCAGRSGAQWIMDLGTSSTAAYAGFPLAEYPNASGNDPVLSLCERMAAEALEDARLPSGHAQLGDAIDLDRAAVLIGLSKGRARALATEAEARYRGYAVDSCQHSSDLRQPWVAFGTPSAGAAQVARSLGIRGPCLAPIAACATGLVAVYQGASLIERGVCDIALCGAADASLEPLMLAAFRNMRVLARSGSDPARAVRPWDRQRSGFLVGEGGAVLVLERADHARARGAAAYANLAGGALGSDAYHMADLDPDPTELTRLIARGLEAASLVPVDIDYVNVHGTATRANDPLECRALRRALGARADSVICSANKAQIGHLLGAAGAAELAITCLAMRDGFVPPTLNLEGPDPACDLDGTPRVGRAREIKASLKLSIGFGGHLAVAALTPGNRSPVPVGDGCAMGGR
jgi:3-oxoacyl-[acyl-carrier-protein] synthase II